jgi:hypothetical protein
MKERAVSDGELSADFERLVKPAFTPFSDNRRRGAELFEDAVAANHDLFGTNQRRSQIDVQVAELVPQNHEQASHILTGFEYLTNGDTSRVADLTNLLRAVEEENTDLSTTVTPVDAGPNAHHG